MLDEEEEEEEEEAELYRKLVSPSGASKEAEAQTICTQSLGGERSRK